MTERCDREKLINKCLIVIESHLEKKENKYCDIERLKELLNEFMDEQDDMNRCLICGVDMGKDNPRQLCGKTYCYNVRDTME